MKHEIIAIILGALLIAASGIGFEYIEDRSVVEVGE